MTWRFGLRTYDVAFSAVMVLGVFIAGVHTILGLYHLATIALLAALAGVAVLGLDYSSRFARGLRPELRELSFIGARSEPGTVRVLHTEGACAQGYREADQWVISQGGGVLGPTGQSSRFPGLCRAAGLALASALGEDSSERERREFACSCPLVNRRVTFAWEPQTEVALAA